MELWVGEDAGDGELAGGSGVDGTDLGAANEGVDAGDVGDGVAAAESRGDGVDADGAAVGVEEGEVGAVWGGGGLVADGAAAAEDSLAAAWDVELAEEPVEAEFVESGFVDFDHAHLDLDLFWGGALELIDDGFDEVDIFCGVADDEGAAVGLVVGAAAFREGDAALFEDVACAEAADAEGVGAAECWGVEGVSGGSGGVDRGVLDEVGWDAVGACDEGVVEFGEGGDGDGVLVDAVAGAGVLGGVAEDFFEGDFAEVEGDGFVALFVWDFEDEVDAAFLWIDFAAADAEEFDDFFEGGVLEADAWEDERAEAFGGGAAGVVAAGVDWCAAEEVGDICDWLFPAGVDFGEGGGAALIACGIEVGAAVFFESFDAAASCAVVGVDA